MSSTIEVTLAETEINKLDGLSRHHANGNRDERRVGSIRKTRDLMVEDLNGRTFSDDEIVQATKSQCD